MAAFGLPKSTEEEKKERTQQIQEATKEAAQIPFEVMQICYHSMEIMKEMAVSGNPNSITDAGVGALCSMAAIQGAFLNVKINAAGLTDNAFARKLITEGNVIQEKAKVLENEILSIVNSKIPTNVDFKTIT